MWNQTLVFGDAFTNNLVEDIAIDSTYKILQEKLYAATYGTNCLSATDRLDYSIYLQLQLYIFGFLNRISTRGGNDLLFLVKEFQPFHKICRDWKTIKRKMNNLTSNFHYLKKIIPFPVEWKMDQWDQSARPEELVIYVRDPVEVISYYLTDPILQFYYSNEIFYDYVELHNSTNERVIRDIMSSDWARLTQEYIRSKDINNILIPIILYTDGVTLGHLQNRQSIPVIGAFRNCSVKLLRKDISKFIVGYIPCITNISKESIINHLITKCGLSRTKASESISIFNLEIERTFWIEVKKPINNCYRNGCLVHIIGKGIRSIHTCVPFTVGDIPAQMHMRHCFLVLVPIYLVLYVIIQSESNNHMMKLMYLLKFLIK